MVSTACPNCHIVLVEAWTTEVPVLVEAQHEAIALGATEISNSWGTVPGPGDLGFDSSFNDPGVPITASSGDSGYQAEPFYPSSSQWVISVGGTTLRPASNSRGWSETAWKGGGSGCEVSETKPGWQTDEGCRHRTVSDVAAVADPETPVSVADSFELPSEFEVEPGWTLLGGTSVSAPLVAGAMALSNAFTKSFGDEAGAGALYAEAAENGTGTLDDITSGSNGTCGTYLCNAGPGYDGPTGLGSLDGAPLVTPTSPVVTTGIATDLTSSEAATLNGTVNPEGQKVTTCVVEYGTTTSYGSTAHCQGLSAHQLAGGSPVDASAHIEGLEPGTVYHFRISGTNASGTSVGTDETLPSPPVVATRPATPIELHTATLHATVNPRGGKMELCTFEYGTTSAYGSSAPCSQLPGGENPVEVSAPITGLAYGTNYHFRISAANLSAARTGADETFTTPQPQVWYSEGTEIPEGDLVPTIDWGNLTLHGEQTGSEISCHNAISGYVENPTGGGPGKEATEALATWDCVINYSCPAGTRGGAAPSLLPWTGTLEEVAGKIRSVSSKAIGAGGTRVIIGCTAPIFSNADFPEPPGAGELTQGGVFVVGAQTSDPLAPAGTKKGTSALHPGFYEWDSGSGLLEEEEPGLGHGNGTVTGKTTGRIKLLGFEDQEHIYVEER